MSHFLESPTNSRSPVSATQVSTTQQYPSNAQPSASPTSSIQYNLTPVPAQRKFSQCQPSGTPRKNSPTRNRPKSDVTPSSFSPTPVIDGRVRQCPQRRSFRSSWCTGKGPQSPADLRMQPGVSWGSPLLALTMPGPRSLRERYDSYRERPGSDGRERKAGRLRRFGRLLTLVGELLFFSRACDSALLPGKIDRPTRSRRPGGDLHSGSTSMHSLRCTAQLQIQKHEGVRLKVQLRLVQASRDGRARGPATQRQGRLIR